RSQYEELFDVSPQMQKVIDEELYTYLADILKLLSEEKSSTNIIDSLVASAPTDVTKMKICPNCDLKNIENQKKTCPNCKTQLLTLTAIQKEKGVEIDNNITNQLTNLLIFKPYRINDEQNVSYTPDISLTQQFTDQGANIPEIYIPDPINVNPNSIASVEQVLLHIEKISGIRDGIRKWVVVACDGVPYRFATKLKEKFPWLVLVPGQLHEEMNMLHAYIELNWEIDLRRFAICQGYRTENQLAYFKKCTDHHKSWDSICIIYRQSMAMELLWPYVKNHLNPSVKGYLAWVKEQQDPLYLIKYEQ
ncbi:5588_t:CDS:2, partial [Scutellospora calospora]